MFEWKILHCFSFCFLLFVIWSQIYKICLRCMFKELTEMKMCGWQIMIVIVKKWSGKENSKKKHTDRCKNDDIQLVMLLCMLNEMIQSSGTTTWMEKIIRIFNCGFCFISILSQVYRTFSDKAVNRWAPVLVIASRHYTYLALLCAVRWFFKCKSIIHSM